MERGLPSRETVGGLRQGLRSGAGRGAEWSRVHWGKWWRLVEEAQSGTG